MYVWHAIQDKSVPHFAAGAPVFRRLMRLNAAGALAFRRLMRSIFRRLMRRVRLVSMRFRRLMRKVRLVSRRFRRLSAAGAADAPILDAQVRILF
jgi:hypothetical protein